MNVVFLDYDGVVNTPMWNADGTRCSFGFPQDNKVNNFQCVQWVSEFCQKFNYSIVVSSTWRLDDNYKECLILDTKPEEIYEWWAVTNWFGEKLKEQGCVVIEAWGKSYWGRCTTGQSISLDGCIVNIAKSMQILDGMENEWSA